MKPASPALIALLANGGTMLMADLFTIVLVDGAVLTYTSLDLPVTWNGLVYSATSAQVSGVRFKIAVGLDVDEQTITIAAKPGDLVGDVPFLVALRRGVLDGASLSRDRAFFGAWGHPPVGVVNVFTGRIAGVTSMGRMRASIKVKSDLILLNTQMPRNTYQAGCIHCVYDAGCGLSKSAHGVAGLAGTGSTAGSIAWAGATTVFSQGTILFTSGANDGVSGTISQATGAALVLAKPLDVPPASGDGFIVYPGCDYTQTTCASRFNNLVNYRGMDYTPVAETAY